jgi:hypothetical protein
MPSNLWVRTLEQNNYDLIAGHCNLEYLVTDVNPLEHQDRSLDNHCIALVSYIKSADSGAAKAAPRTGNYAPAEGALGRQALRTDEKPGAPTWQGLTGIPLSFRLGSPIFLESCSSH